jgi:hypothetical protein
MDGARTERRHSTFLPGLHAFRAIATVMVVGQHAAWALPWPPDSTARRVLADVLDNSAVLFVFLAGFLFAHLFGRYSYTGFLRRRFTMVVLPYLCVLAPAAVLAVLSPASAARSPTSPGSRRCCAWAGSSCTARRWSTSRCGSSR